MSSQKLKYKRNNDLNSVLYKSQTEEKYLNLRKKDLSSLDTKIKASLSNLNFLLNKIDRTKDLVLNNNFDKKDIKSLKNLGNNSLILTKNLRKEANKATKLAYGYNLSSRDLDTFLSKLRRKKKYYAKKQKNKIDKIEEIEEIKKDNLENYKNEFDLALAGKNQEEKILNNSFLKDQKRMRDLYNLKLELNLIEQKKKIGDRRSFDDIKSSSSTLKIRDISKNYKCQKVKSKYYAMYELSKSFKIENELMEKNILLNEDYQSDEDIFITNNTNMLPITKKTLLKEEDKNNDNDVKINNNNKKIFYKKKKPFSARMVKDTKEIKNFNNSAIIKSPKNKANNSGQAIRLKLKSGTNLTKKDIDINNNSNSNKKGLYNKIYKANFRNRTGQLVSQKTSKFSTKSSSRPLSSLSNFNNTTWHFINNKNKKMNRSMSNIYTNSLKSDKNFKKYMSKIDQMLRYSDYSTDKFKSSFRKLNKEKLFVKSTNKIFERKKIVNIDKIIKNLNLDRIRHEQINDKKLVYDNSLKVKLLLNLKNRKILNTIILTLFDEQRRVNDYFVDTSLFEKNMKKNERNKIFNKMSYKIINLEKKYDKEQILDELNKMDENVEEFIRKIEKKDIYDENEYKFILVKNKNMKMMDREKKGKINFNGNLHKKHLVNKYKTIE